ncbi:hypothetical protein A2U01_0058395, partial [Trifolium medium]|nr:hypothetical protein [Trifolium medium]
MKARRRRTPCTPSRPVLGPDNLEFNPEPPPDRSCGDRTVVLPLNHQSVFTDTPPPFVELRLHS